jgi:hypothetical protein
MNMLVEMAKHELEMTLENFLSSLVTDTLQLHLGWDPSTSAVCGVLITGIEEDGFGNRFCNIRAVRGERMEEWFDDYDSLERWAWEHAKCRAMRVTGRIGWRRVLEREGYAMKAVILEKPLEI